LLREQGIQTAAVRDHLWVFQFKSPPQEAALAVLREWRDERCESGWIFVTEGGLQAALELAGTWPGPGGCWCDKALDILEKTSEHWDWREVTLAPGPQWLCPVLFRRTVVDAPVITAVVQLGDDLPDGRIAAMAASRNSQRCSPELQRLD